MKDEMNRALLIPSADDQDELQVPRLRSGLGYFIPDADDIPPITSGRVLLREFRVEFGKLWYLAAPAMFTSICQYSLGAVTQTFAGHISTLDLAAFSVENTVIAGLSFGVMWGMGSALETLCGQAYGAGQMEMLGVYMQRSWIILLATSLLLTLIYVFAEPILLVLGQDKDISRAAAQFSWWMIPQLYAYALNFPISKFLQAQSKMMAMAWISAAALVLHFALSWLLMLRLGWGMAGGAMVLNASWWFVVVAQLVYIWAGACPQAWTGFSSQAFRNLWGFVKLSAASAVMLCLEMWYFTALVLFAGYLKNAQLSVDALSICMNILGWTIMISFGLNAAVSVRVSNELGAAHPRTAKFSMVVVVVTATLLSLVVAVIILIFEKQYPSVFIESPKVKEIVYELTPLLALCVVINNVQPALSGVAIGAGWQALVAYVNIGCYYMFGIPLGLLMGYVLNMGVKGIWIGMITGTIVQTFCLFLMVYRTNWNKEASAAADRIKKWGGEIHTKADNQLVR
ncbi:MATE efflux family protein [Striga hermonthica]|uniref:Protein DETOXIFICATION n=1 Tax=Striga hermonthica TaxID=68872 RepID=A0A9N7NR04_STRHE|nr:MATE efflux family protein [Striga hermonthica]